MIDILIPVLGRPHNAAKVAASIELNTREPHEIVFLCSDHDVDEIDACKATGATVYRCEADSYAHKVNVGWTFTEADFVFLAADDLRFHPRWDREALEVHAETGAGVVGTNDLGNPSVKAGRHATHSLVARSYAGCIDDPALLVHEGYRHNFVDNEMVETAMKRGQWAFAFKSHVEHLHPFWHKGVDDAIYRLGRDANIHDMRLYRKRRRLWR